MAALLVARDGIVPAGPVQAGLPPAVRPELGPAARLRRIEPHFAGAALLSELSEGLSVAGTEAEVTLACPDGPLLVLRPPGFDDLQAELQLVAGYAELRAERLPEIQAQTDQIAGFFGTILPIHPAWTPSVVLLMEVIQGLATAIVQRIKLIHAVPRPHLLSPLIQPVISCPGHSSFPSGHATQAFALAGLLAALEDRDQPQLQGQPERMAARIAVNRTVAGLHYPCDSAAGAALGMVLARWMMARATGVPLAGLVVDAPSWGMDAPAGSRDFHLPALVDALDGGTCLAPSASCSVAVAPMLASLWQAARTEWDQRWG